MTHFSDELTFYICFVINICITLIFTNSCSDLLEFFFLISQTIAILWLKIGIIKEFD